MATRCWCALLLGHCLSFAGDSSRLDAATPDDPLTRSIQNRDSPERRGLQFLAQEVPRWSQENHCFSCHNNGDAARALYIARQLGYPIPDESLRDTSVWLLSPDRWKDNGGDQEFSDRRLADLQFAFSLCTAVEAKVLADGRAAAALSRAAELIVAHQSQDGSWSITATRAIGSPATYGRFLASAAALRVLERSAEETLREPIAKAHRWLVQQRPLTVLDSAATLLAVGNRRDCPRALREHCLQVIRRGEAPPGGWGPYVTSAPEPFDTAVVLLALADLEAGPQLSPLIVRGRKFLITHQLDDGGWVETTRPAGTVSYAQRLSTCGWATLSLLKTVRAEDGPRR